MTPLRRAGRWIANTLLNSFFGQAMIHRVEDLRRYAAAAPSLPENQDRSEVRMYSIFVTALFVLLQAEPIFYITTVEASMVSKVANLAPSQWCISGTFVACLIGALPHLGTLVFRPDMLDNKRFRVWATLAALLSSVMWMWLANLALPIDADGVEWAYGIRALATLCVAMIYAYSVNAQQLREARYASVH